VENFYTAKEAQKKLGVNVNKFQYMVRKGQIKKVILPGHKYGVYPKEQVNRLAAAIEATAELYVHDASVFELATEADLPEIYAMVARTMPRVTPIEIQRAWIKRNPEAFYTLRDNGIVVAYACVFPVNYRWLERVLKDEIRIGDVPVKEIYPFTPGRPLDVYIRDLIVGKTNDKEKFTHYAQRMISELVHVFNQLGTRGIEIHAIYAFATTPHGNNLCQRLHFDPLTEFAQPHLEGVMPYKLDVAIAKTPLIEGYKQEYEHYKAYHR